MKNSYIGFLFLLFLIGITGSSHAQESWDWHIAGGHIVDGTGAPAYRADLLIRGDSIGYIGPVDPDTVEAAWTADATGKIVTPGFIDPHAHGDPLRTPGFRNFLAMGVTTILLGQDGASPAGGPLEVWFEEVGTAAPAVNVATLSGHATIRTKAGAGSRAASGPVLSRMQKILENDLHAGAYGLSTGLEYVPGMYADQQELVRMAAVAGRHDAIVMSHMRSEDDAHIKTSLDELAAQGREARVHASHLKVVYGEGAGRAVELLRYIDTLRARGIELTADTYPYSASYTGIGIVFPEWAKTDTGWRQALDERPEALKLYLQNKVKQRNGPDAILFGSGQHAGKTLGEAAAEEGRSFVDLLMEMGPRAASAAHFVMDQELQDRIITAPDVMISSDGSPTMRHPRGYGSFAKIIHDYVSEKGTLSIVEAIYKMSGLPAKTIGFEKRGLVLEGYKADLLMFDPGDIRDTATFEQPHRPAEGFDWIWVNGRLVREEGAFKEGRYGRVLKRAGPSDRSSRSGE